ncbi:MAG: fused response regulator/phosphatase, partial [Planctomycetes bacterium]|nr:fused response regulator/phosphatase [Planctomycetota bacterium]
MPDIKGPIFDFLRLFNKMARALKTYGKSHPSIVQDTEKIMKSLADAYRGQDAIALGQDQGVLVVRGELVKDKSEVVQKFVESMKSIRIANFTIRKGVTPHEVLELIRIAGMKSEDAIKNNRLDPELLRSFRNIKVVEARYVLVTDSEEVVDRSLIGSEGTNKETGEQADLQREAAKLLKDAGITKKEEIVKLIDQMFESQLGGPEAQGPIAGGVDGVIDFFNRMVPHIQELEPEVASEKMNGYFNSMLGRVLDPNAGLEQVLADLQKAVTGLPGQCQEVLFGTDMQSCDKRDLLGVLKRLNPNFQAGLLQNEVRSGKLPTDELKMVIDALAPSPDEFIGLMDMVTGELIKAGGSLDDAQEQMKRLFRLLPVVEETMNIQGSILIIDADQGSVAGYTKDLWDSGYLVTPHDNGKRAMEALHEKKTFDVIIMDVRLPGMTGLEILNQLANSDEKIPVIITTENPRFQDAFEVVGYPRLRFFLKPVEASDILSAVMDFCPPKEDGAESEKLEAHELQRAHEVQMCLVPQKLPTLPGFDVSVYYQAAQDVSGDYYDLIPLTGGKYGIVVADVSGKNVSGAMVMVMVRTVFRSVAPNSLSPKSTLIEVNKFLVKDIRRGMFVSAIYGVLDPESRALTLANAGHNPPLVWTRTAGFSEFMELPGMAMGVSDSWRFEDSLREETVLFEPTDRLLLYTDGVTEAMSVSKEEFTEKRFLKLVNFHRGADSATLLKEVVKAVEVHRGLAPQSDDITMLAMRYVPDQLPAEGEEPSSPVVTIVRKSESASLVEDAPAGGEEAPEDAAAAATTEEGEAGEAVAAEEEAMVVEAAAEAVEEAAPAAETLEEAAATEAGEAAEFALEGEASVPEEAVEAAAEADAGAGAGAAPVDDLMDYESVWEEGQGPAPAPPSLGQSSDNVDEPSPLPPESEGAEEVPAAKVVAPSSRPVPATAPPAAAAKPPASAPTAVPAAGGAPRTTTRPTAAPPPASPPATAPVARTPAPANTPRPAPPADEIKEGKVLSPIQAALARTRTVSLRSPIPPDSPAPAAPQPPAPAAAHPVGTPAANTPTTAARPMPAATPNLVRPAPANTPAPRGPAAAPAPAPATPPAPVPPRTTTRPTASGLPSTPAAAVAPPPASPPPKDAHEGKVLSPIRAAIARTQTAMLRSPAAAGPPPAPASSAAPAPARTPIPPAPAPAPAPAAPQAPAARPASVDPPSPPTAPASTGAAPATPRAAARPTASGAAPGAAL